MSGCELAEKVREMQPGLKVLIISDTAEDESSKRYHTINKPFTSESLLRKIRKILE
jgi:two-component SAPR family response regulator